MRFFTASALVLAALAAPLSQAQEATMTRTTDQSTQAQQLIDKHFALWNDQNPSHWAAQLPQVYTPDLYLADYQGTAKGYDGVMALLQRVQQQHPGFTFTPQPITWNHDLGRVTWYFGPQDNPKLVSGEDIFTLRDGRLASLHVFINQP